MEALTGPQDCVEENRVVYQRRRDRVVQALRRLDLRVAVPRASLYIWAHVPEGFTSAQFAARLLEEINIVVTPGSSYGKCGEGYIRLSLTTPDERVEEGCRRLEGWRTPPPARS
jgi:LL-diaminopimelate aminotransferase